jgi:hypothetical protein
MALSRGRCRGHLRGQELGEGRVVGRVDELAVVVVGDACLVEREEQRRLLDRAEELAARRAHHGQQVVAAARRVLRACVRGAGRRVEWWAEWQVGGL